MSEVFPLEIRALAIAFFYAVGTAIGGIVGPALFGKLIGSKSFTEATVGFLIAAGWLIGAGITAFFLAVDAEQRPLEDVAEPLSAEDGADGGQEEAPRRRPVPRGAGGMWAPPYAYSATEDEDVMLEGQVAAIERAVGETDEPLPERQLLSLANSRYWGPGVARRALRRAVAEGRVERTGGRYRAARRRVR